MYQPYGRHTVAFGLWGSKSKVPSQVYGNFDEDDVDYANRMLRGLLPRAPTETSSPVRAPYHLLRTVSWEGSLLTMGFKRLSEAAKINLFCALNITPAAFEDNGRPRDRRLLLHVILDARLALEARQAAPLWAPTASSKAWASARPGWLRHLLLRWRLPP